MVFGLVEGSGYGIFRAATHAVKYGLPKTIAVLVRRLALQLIQIVE